MAGRKPLPTKLHVINGNPSRKRLPDNEPNPPALPTLDAPEWLDALARERWSTLVPELDALGLITTVDIDAMAAYCKAYSRWREAEEFLDRAGTTVMKTQTGYVQQLPQVAIARKYADLMHKLAVEFGLTPSSRTRLAPNTFREEDEMKAIIGG